MDTKKPITVEDLQKERDEIAKQFDELEKRSADPKYQDRDYAEDVQLDISSTLFTSFVNTQANTKVTLSTIQQNLIAAHNAIELLTNTNAALTLELMKTHMRFIDEGKTVPSPVAAAEVKEKPKKQTKKNAK